jgi:hypothetical protein
MRVNHGLIFIKNESAPSRRGPSVFSRFSTNELMKMEIVEHCQLLGRLGRERWSRAGKKFQNSTNELMNPGIIECTQSVG